MSARAAAILPEALVDVFEHVPEYRDYEDSDAVKSSESEFRISLGRVIKAWGDQLLDVAENRSTPLSRQELESIDVILGEIAELFDQLNRFQPTRLTAGERARRDRLRRADARIIAIMEEADRSIQLLRDRRRAARWLDDEAASMAQSLQALVTGLERRNDVLLAPSGRPVPEPEDVR